MVGMPGHWQYSCSFHAVFEWIAHHIIINSPAKVPFTGANSETPPCVVMRLLVKIPERIDEPGINKFSNPCTFLWQKTRAFSITDWIMNINGPVANIIIAGNNKVRPGLFKFIDIIVEIAEPCHLKGLPLFAGSAWRMINTYHCYVAKIGNFSFSHTGLQLTSGSESHSLTHREAELLAYLCLNAGSILKRDDILNKVWGNDHFFSSRSLDVFISRLRKLLKSDTAVKIENIHNIGYRLMISRWSFILFIAALYSNGIA